MIPGSAQNDPAGGDLAALSTLADSTRRRLYHHVVAARTPVTRDDVSAVCGLERSVVGYHLDKLVAAGLLTVEYARPEGRTGPGAGRPAKWYERAETELSVTVPPRAYQLAAEVLARTLDGADPSVELGPRVQRLAVEAGRELAQAHCDQPGATDAALACLAAWGFEPYDDDGVIRLGNCPFHALAQGHAQLICTMNQGLLAGVLEGLAADLHPCTDDGSATCCVALCAQGSSPSG